MITTDARREQMLDHIFENCPSVCGGDPQVLADAEDATDAELATYIGGMHDWHAKQQPAL
jgi:hypothetical protein